MQISSTYEKKTSFQNYRHERKEGNENRMKCKKKEKVKMNESLEKEEGANNEINE